MWRAITKLYFQVIAMHHQFGSRFAVIWEPKLGESLIDRLLLIAMRQSIGWQLSCHAEIFARPKIKSVSETTTGNLVKCTQQWFSLQPAEGGKKGRITSVTQHHLRPSFHWAVGTSLLLRVRIHISGYCSYILTTRVLLHLGMICDGDKGGG